MPLSVGDARTPSNTMSTGPRPTSYEVLCIQPFGHNGHGAKSGVGAVVPFLGELGLHLTQCCLGRKAYLHMEWHFDPSMVSPQYTNVTSMGV